MHESIIKHKTSVAFGRRQVGRTNFKNVSGAGTQADTRRLRQRAGACGVGGSRARSRRQNLFGILFFDVFFTLFIYLF